MVTPLTLSIKTAEELTCLISRIFSNSLLYSPSFLNFRSLDGSEVQNRVHPGFHRNWNKPTLTTAIAP